MRKFLLGMTAGVVFAAPAVAADLPARMSVKAPPPEVFSWTGGYIGGHAGYAFGRSRTDVGRPDALDCGNAEGCESISHKTDGAFGGLHAGYNWQSNAVVFGIEAEGGYIGAEGSTFSTISEDHFFSAKYGAYGALTARLGVAAGRTLFYAKGGGAVAWIKNEAFDDFPTIDTDHIGRKSG